MLLYLYRLKRNCRLGFKHEQWTILTVLQTKQGTQWCFAVNRLCPKLDMGAMFMSIIRWLYAITDCPDVTKPSHILPGAFMGGPKTLCRIILTWNVFSIVFKIMGELNLLIYFRPCFWIYFSLVRQSRLMFCQSRSWLISQNIMLHKNNFANMTKCCPPFHRKNLVGLVQM